VSTCVARNIKKLRNLVTPGIDIKKKKRSSRFFNNRKEKIH